MALSEAIGSDSKSQGEVAGSIAANHAPVSDLASQSIDCNDRKTHHWKSLDLADALRVFMCRSPELQQVVAEIELNRANAALVDLQSRPLWRANAEYNDYRNFNSSGSAGRTFATSISMSWQLLDFGRRDADSRAAKEALEAVELTSNTKAGDELLNFLQLFGDAVIAQAKLESTRLARTTAAQTQAAARARYEAKVGSRIELLQAQTAFAQARLEHVKAQSSWTSARASLAIALGSSPELDFDLRGWEPRTAAIDLAIPTGDALETLVANHPRFKAAGANVRAAEARLALVDANLRPSVSLGASLGKVRNWGAAGVGTVPNSSATIMASVPLFDEGQASSQRRQAQASIDAALAQQESERRAILQALWSAQSQLLASREAMQMSEELLNTATATFEVAEGRYKAGVGTMQDLLSAQAALSLAREQQSEILVAHVSSLTSAGIARGEFPTLEHRNGLLAR